MAQRFAGDAFIGLEESRTDPGGHFNSLDSTQVEQKKNWLARFIKEHDGSQPEPPQQPRRCCPGFGSSRLVNLRFLSLSGLALGGFLGSFLAKSLSEGQASAGVTNRYK